MSAEHDNHVTGDGNNAEYRAEDIFGPSDPSQRTVIGAQRHTPYEVAEFYRYPVDHSVNCGGVLHSHPPALHPRRCQATTSLRVQCSLWATRGDNTCHFHKNRGALFTATRMKGYYTRSAGPTLKEKLKELEGTDEAKKLSLEGEVDMARILAERAIHLFDVACVDAESSKKASSESKALAMHAARAALTHVANIVSEASKSRLMNNEMLDVRGIDFIIAQVVTILETIVLPLVGREVMDSVIAEFKNIRVPDNTKLHIVVQ